MRSLIRLVFPPRPATDASELEGLRFVRGLHVRSLVGAAIMNEVLRGTRRARRLRIVLASKPWGTEAAAEGGPNRCSGHAGDRKEHELQYHECPGRVLGV